MTSDPEAVFLQNEELARAYRLCFGSPAGQAVLKDLAPFCRAILTTREPDMPMELLEGRRQVYLRIMNIMNLTPEEIRSISLGFPTRQGDNNG
jgi:hypothetical protein